MATPPSATSLNVENIVFPSSVKPPGGSNTLFLGGAGRLRAIPLLAGSGRENAEELVKSGVLLQRDKQCTAWGGWRNVWEGNGICGGFWQVVVGGVRSGGTVNWSGFGGSGKHFATQVVERIRKRRKMITELQGFEDRGMTSGW
ncbi:chalcone isomerase [Tanacetum coccineum]